MGSKKKTLVVTSDPLALIAKKTNVSRSKEKVGVSSNSEGSEADDFSELKKITALLAKAFNRRNFYYKPTNNNLRTSSTSQSANKKQEFVKTDNKKVEKKDDEKKRDMSKVKCYNCRRKDISQKIARKSNLFVNNDDDQKKFHDAIESASENFIENHIDSQKDYDKSDVDHNDSEEKDHLVDRKQIVDQKVLYDKMSVQLVELDKHVRDLKNTILEKDFKIFEVEECGRNKDLEIGKCLEQTSSLKPYVPNVILKKIIIDLEVKVLNLLEKEKAKLETIESLKSKCFESSETVISESENQSENDFHVVEKKCDKVENSKVIAPGMFKLSVSQSVSPISMSKTSFESNNVEIKLKRKRRKRKSSKQNVKQVDNDVSRANSDFVHFSDLDTFSSVRRPKNSNVI
nr:hypothetical protein [Tanacetum cinerariifolium]